MIAPALALRRRWWTITALAILLVGWLLIYSAAIPQIITYLNPLTGDEPFYVMTALSLIHDRDLDETNNYAQRDYASFYPTLPLPADWQGWSAVPDPLPPHPAHSVRPGLYSKHGFGVVALITLPYLLGGRIGVMLLLNCTAALVSINMLLLARRAGLSWGLATLTVLSLALANPLLSYAYLIFPETFAALAIIYVWRRSRAQHNNGCQWLAIGCCLAILPWLHARFLPAVIGLTCLCAGHWLAERKPYRQALAVAPLLLSAVALLTYYWSIYGRPFPATEDHAGFNDLPGIVNAAFGLFLDEQWGLLIHAPIYLLAALGLVPLWRTKRHDLFALAAVILPYLALVAWYRVWWGEWGPAARYLTPVVPLAIVPLACWLRQTRRMLALPLIVLAALPGWVIMAGFLQQPQLMYNQPDGANALFSFWAQSLGQQWPKFLPSFQPYALSPVEERWRWSLLLLCLTLILIILGHLSTIGRRHASRRREYSPD